MSEERFVLVGDDDGHWYMIPKDRIGEWWSWVDLPEDDERSWEAPDYALPLNGSPSNVSFTNPVIS